MLPHASGLLDQLMPIVYLYMGPQKDIGDTFEWGKKDMQILCNEQALTNSLEIEDGAII